MPFIRQILNGSARWWCLGLIIACWAAISVQTKGEALSGLQRLDHLPPDNPLVGQWIRVIYQDRWGFLWLGTLNGVHRFDGFAVKSFRHDAGDPRSLPNNFVNSIFEDSQGVLWIATMGGLTRLDDQLLSTESGQFVTANSAGLFTTFQHDPEDPNSLSNDRVSGIAEDAHGVLWVSTTAGVNRFDRDSQSFTHFALDASDLSSTRTLTVFVSRAGDLWFGASGPALLRLDHEVGALERHPLLGIDQASGHVWKIAEDEDGFLWSGTQDGSLFRFDPRTGDADRIRLSAEANHGGISTLLPQPDGSLWIGTDQGLHVLETSTGKSRVYRPAADQPGSLSGAQVSAMLRDRSGVVWLGTNAGLDKYVPSKERFTLYRHRESDPTSISADAIEALVEDSEGGLWIGTEAGIEQMDATGRVIRRFRHDPEDPDSLISDSTDDLFRDSRGDLWITTDRGLDHFDTEREVFVHLRYDSADAQGLVDSIYCLTETEPGILWIGGRGLNRFDTRTRRLRRYDEPGVVIAMLPAPGKGLWLATYGRGLQHLDPAEEIFSTYRHDPDDPRSLSSDFLAALHRDASGVLWIGTLGGGLNRFDPARKEFTNYRERDGLTNDNVEAILEDSTGMLWLSTHRGLSRFDPATETWSSYTAEDGLQGSVFKDSAVRLSTTGEMFFGGGNGLTGFHPQHITKDARAPDVAITDFLLLNRSTPFATRRTGQETVPHLVLSHHDDIFAFRFAALHFAQPGRNRYAYMLEGFNDDWIETDARNRLAQYTNLDSGDYVFRAKAANPDGVWNEAGTAVRITVLPPPWQTWWAYSLYTLALATVVLGYVRSQRHELRRQREVAEHERAVNRRLREVDKLKDEFLANTSHELRTPLYGITGLAESLIDGVAGDVPDAVRDNLSMIAASGRRLSHLVGDIVDFSKLRHQSLELNRVPVDLKPLADVVLTLSRSLVGTKDLELINAVPADLPAAHADENRLQQILYNLIGNAVKFTASGSVEVSAAATDGMLHVRIADTGIGIPEADRERIFGAFEQADASIEREFGGTGLGLAVTRQLVEIHGGEIHLESTVGVGSTFCFSLPIATEATGEASSLTTDSRAALPALRDERHPPGVEDTPTASDSAPPSNDSEGPRVLVVDDETINLQVVRNYLTVERFQLTLASSGEEALRLLEEHPFDLVLLDVMMPRISGYEVCRTLRESHALSDLPVIFLTAKTQDSDVVTGMALGANDYLTKPITKDRLLARVRPHLDLLNVHRNLEGLVAEKMSEIKVLEGILPICAGCKKIRDDEGAWSEFEVFVAARSEADFSHGICPDCVARYHFEHRDDPS